MRDSPPMTRRNFVRVSTVLAGTILVGGSVGRSGPAPAQPQTREPKEPVKEAIGDTVAIGFLAALSGPDGGWGQPGLTGNRIFIDRVNAEGGLLVGGVRYPLKLYVFDDEAIASKALQGARELVLEHDVKFISAIGGAPADAVHPFLTEKKVVYASLISTDIKPDRPYLIAGGDVTPRIDMLRPWYHNFNNPNLQRWAVLSQDDPIGLQCQAWEVGAAKAEGWEVVHDKHYPIDTTDFAPIVSAVLATKPDVVSLNLSWPTFVTLIIEQLSLQGFKGIISANYIDTESALQKVPVEYLEGATDSFPLFDDPWWGEPSWQHEFIREWRARYGPGAPKDVHRQITGIDWDHVITLMVWAEGAQLAGTFDPDAILATLRAQKSFQTILGPAKMYGKEMWGLDNMISPPIPITEVRNGVKRIQAVVRFEPWFESRKDQIIKVVQEKGQMWYQRM